jgi:hypothetical protein
LRVDEGDLLTYELDTFEIGDAPPYIALSYCWTQASVDRPILVNDEVVLVRRKLLDYLTESKNGDEHYWLFVDAPCIDLEHVSDKSNLVAMMGEIYGQAAAVIAWLGLLEDGLEKLQGFQPVLTYLSHSLPTGDVELATQLLCEMSGGDGSDIYILRLIREIFACCEY